MPFKNVETARLLELVERMPAFSHTVAKIIALANDPASSPKDLVSAISMDAVLTAKLLKLINSAYFGLRQPVVSLQRAVIMLGFNTVKNIALSISVTGTLKISKGFKWFTPDQFWEHSLGCAVASKALAQRLEVGNMEVEEYFIAGLLHDIGKTLLLQAFTQALEEVYEAARAPGASLIALEKERFGMSHDELGGVIARHWKFPEPLVAAIAGHHNPLEGPTETLRLRVVPHIANAYCNMRKISTHPDVNPDTISGQVWEALSLTPKEAFDSLKDLEGTLQRAKIFLQVAAN